MLNESVFLKCNTHKLKGEVNEDSANYTALKRLYKDSEVALEFLEKVAETVMRYKNTHYRGIYTLAKMYTSCEMESAMAHCIEVDNCTIHELAAYLIYRYGERKARYSGCKITWRTRRVRLQK